MPRDTTALIRYIQPPQMSATFNALFAENRSICCQRHRAWRRRQRRHDMLFLRQPRRRWPSLFFFARRFERDDGR
jgi:hypothetical protein